MKQKLISAWTWLRDNVWIIVTSLAAVVGGVVVFMITRKPPESPLAPAQQIARQREILEAGRKAGDDAIVLGKERAAAVVLEAHKDSIEQFDDAQKQKAAELEQDPDELAKWLTSLSRKA